MNLGEINQISVVKKTAEGYVVTVNGGDEIVMPNELIKTPVNPEDKLDAFIFESEGNVLATNMTPKIFIDEFALLKLKTKGPFFAEMDMGLGEYTLRVPLREQIKHMEEGEVYLIRYFTDETSDKQIGSCQIESFLLDSNDSGYEPGEKVKLQAFKFTNLGIKVIVDNNYEGLLYDSEVFQDVVFGETIHGFVKKRRQDNKLDVTLQPFGYKKVQDNTSRILTILKQKDGILHLGDKSDPEAISALLSMSKKTFKKAIGALYKKGIIKIEPKSIHLIQK